MNRASFWNIVVYGDNAVRQLYAVYIHGKARHPQLPECLWNYQFLMYYGGQFNVVFSPLKWHRKRDLLGMNVIVKVRQFVIVGDCIYDLRSIIWVIHLVSYCLRDGDSDVVQKRLVQYLRVPACSQN